MKAKKKNDIEKMLREAYFNYIEGSQVDVGQFWKDVSNYAQNNLNAWSVNAHRGSKNKALFQVIDFFCGCGGMSLGFASLSLKIPFFKIIAGFDFNKDAAKSYSRNFGVDVIESDIYRFYENFDSLKKRIEKIDDYDPNTPLVIIGCPPCQGFSSHRKKNWSNDDPRNSLVGIFASISVRLNPVCIIMENVPEMLSSKYWQHFETAKKMFENSGYVVYQSIYNAASFGVPQERFRAIVIAMKRDFLMPTPILKTSEYKTVRQAIAHLPEVAPGEYSKEDKMHRSARHKKETIETIKAVPKDGGSRPRGIGPKCLDKIKGFSDVYGRLYWDKPSITITGYSRNPASGRYTHPEQDRGLTMREAALLQSFPTGFEFCGSFDSIFKQIGEAVPPKMACFLASGILSELLSSPLPEKSYVQGIRIINSPVSNSYSSVIAGIKNGRKD